MGSWINWNSWFKTSAIADAPAQCPVEQTSSDAKQCPHKVSSATNTSACPVDHTKWNMNPLNHMEEIPNEALFSSATSKLSQQRVSSTIPKGDYTPEHQQDTKDKSNLWVYPSEQQYYNAMKRKGWNPQERDMKSIVAIHNTINERAWLEILKWEAVHYQAGSNQMPKLIKFQGRPKDPSPKARFFQLLGYRPPFDRHDWLVDRNGESIRYVIDFYSGQVSSRTKKPLAMYLDVRPALDSPGLFWDRLYMHWMEVIAPSIFPFGEKMKLERDLKLNELCHGAPVVPVSKEMTRQDTSS